MTLPRLLILDDLFGRNVSGGRNADRENLCALFLWRDQTGDAAAIASRQEVLAPRANVVFARAQSPACARVGDTVENDIAAALQAVASGWPTSTTLVSTFPEQTWAMVLLDLCFYTGTVTEDSNRRTPGMPVGRAGDDTPSQYFGLTLLDVIHRDFPELPICILSSKPRAEVSLEFSRRGALGFIARDDPNAPELLETALWQHALLLDPADEIIGQSIPLLVTLREARRASRHRENLLIRGERGTGKESLAAYIHRTTGPPGTRGGRPFVTVNSAAFTPALAASELFGIEPRTATGVDGKIGLIEAADRGDLFLDEIADMPREVQGAILRVLQEHQITPVGARRSKSVDVRFLSATNRDLDEPGIEFRSDLLDRLRSGGTLLLPPLRHRLNDIPLLAESFIREAEGRRRGAIYRAVTPDALQVLARHSWPGNIRELRSVIFDAVNRHPDVEYLVPEHLRLSTQSLFSLDTRNDPLAFDTLRPVSGSRVPVQPTLDALIEMLRDLKFDATRPADWAGQFGRLHTAIADVMARYLKAALLASRRPTPDTPEGEILIHPAIKLLTGDRTLSASKAADVIKRCLNVSRDERDRILEDEILRDAHEIAMRLRPSATSKTPKSGRSKNA